jgi:hypothetical protein
VHVSARNGPRTWSGSRKAICSPSRPDRLWDLQSPTVSVYQEVCHQGESDRDVKQTTDLNLQRLVKYVDVYLHSLTRLHHVVLAQLSMTVGISVCPLTWSSGQISCLQIQRSRVRFTALSYFVTSSITSINGRR